MELVEVIKALGSVGAVAATASIVTVAVTRHYDVKDRDKQEKLAVAREQREESRRNTLRKEDDDASYRRYQRKTLMELQEALWPLQEFASNINLIKNGDHERLTGTPRLVAFVEVNNQFSETNNRCEVLISRLDDMDLRTLAESVRTAALNMANHSPNETAVEKHRTELTGAYHDFQVKSRHAIRALMKPSG